MSNDEYERDDPEPDWRGYVQNMYEAETKKTHWKDVIHMRLGSEQYRMPIPDAQFTQLVDEIVVSSQNDPELVDALKWVDEMARKNEVSFYDMAANVLFRNVA